jgi:arginine/lysine/ornithine decarboxylase
LFGATATQRGQGAPASLRSLLGEQALRHDLTELEGLDYLSAPRGVIADAQARQPS